MLTIKAYIFCISNMVSPIAHNQYDEKRYDDGEAFPNKTIHYINKSLTIYYKILYLDSTHK